MAGNDDPHAIANTKRKAYNQVKNGSCRPTAAKGILTKKSSNNQDVSCIIELLENI